MLRSFLVLCLVTVFAWPSQASTQQTAAPSAKAKPAHPVPPHKDVAKHSTASHPAVPAHPAAPAAAAPVAVLPPPTTAPAEPAKGTNTGLPLPRFASLKTDEVNLRSGPGLRYPIEWVYRRRDLPVEIQREFEVWRLIADQEGVKGWVHQATLVGRRTFVVTGAEQIMRTNPQDTSNPVARLKTGVVGRLRLCEAKADWCEVQVGDYRGWLKRSAFWGTYPGEAIQ